MLIRLVFHRQLNFARMKLTDDQQNTLYRLGVVEDARVLKKMGSGRTQYTIDVHKAT